MEPHSASDVLQAYARGERRFTYLKLIAVDLHGTDLRDANFYGTDFSNANLSGTDLTRANLGKADLYNANLSGANLSGAYYQDANLTRADMSGIITNNPSPVLSASQPAVSPGFPASQPGVVSWGPPAPAGTVNVSAAAAAQTAQVCAQCGAQLPAGALFCSRCGRPTGAQAAQGAAPSIAESPATMPPTAAPPSVPLAPTTPTAPPTANVRYAYPTTASASAQLQRPTPTTTAQRAPQRPPDNKVVTGIAVTAFAITSLWEFIYKAAIVILVIVGIVFFVRGCAANATLNEHSSCGQFNQADSSTQDQVLQQMETAHGDSSPTADLPYVRASVDLYCAVYGDNAAIDGIYGNGGGNITPRHTEAQRRIVAPKAQEAIMAAARDRV